MWPGVPMPADAMLIIPGLAFSVSNKLGDGGGRDRWIDLHHERPAHEAGDWCYVANKIEIERFIERRIDRVRHTDQEERIAICRRFCDRLGANVGTRARSILNDERLTKTFR